MRLLLEGTSLERRRTWTLTVGQTLLPARLENLLVARIDALPEGARRLAQVAAVIGRTFEVPLLERVADADDVADELLALVRAEIVRELRRYPDLVCEFRHGLLHEAALSTLTPGRHRELAGQVGAALEELLGRPGGGRGRADRPVLRAQRPARQGGHVPRARGRGREQRPGHGAELLEAARRAAARQGDVEAERRVGARLLDLPADGADARP